MAKSLTDLFGRAPRVEILEVFGEYAEDDLSVPFLAEHVTASISTIHKYLGELVREGLVMTSLKEGKTQYYRFNLNNQNARIIAYILAKFLAEGLAEHLGEMGIPTLKEVNQKPSGLAEKEKSIPIAAVPA